MKSCFAFAIVLTLFASELAAVGGNPVGMVGANAINAGFSTEGSTLVGNSEGLFSVDSDSARCIWRGSEVLKIVEARDKSKFFLTSDGVVFSKDLHFFDIRNDGLPRTVMKRVADGEVVFETRIQTLNDLKVLPSDPKVVVTATNASVFLSKDAGVSWTELGQATNTTGIVSVCAATLPKQNSDEKTLTIFASHSIYGVSFCQPDVSKKWFPLDDGFDLLETTENADEVSDILAAEGDGDFDEVFFLQAFRRFAYRLDWKNKSVDQVWSDESTLDAMHSLSHFGGSLFCLRLGGFGEIYLDSKTANFAASKEVLSNKMFKKIFANVKRPCCALMTAKSRACSLRISLSDLWLLDPAGNKSGNAVVASGKRGLYLPANSVSNQKGIDKYLDIMQKNDLNALVIDMKDDYGLLRYRSEDENVLEYATSSRYAIDVDDFIRQMKENGKYLIARIVVFKDANLWSANKNKFAVWDWKRKRPWQGISHYENEKNADGEETGNKIPSYFDEKWVDPHSVEVWRYNVAIAEELVRRGFDEIQFDYIRFPTDGLNLSNAQYRFREENMSKMDCLTSFLNFARENIDAPIGVDIYGANGFYRTGARTGQDVELLSRYVDVISPMFYPSHFEQGFFAQNPAELRSYRIYFCGNLRAAAMAKGRSEIRSWVQAFYLPVSYDKKYYDEKYVENEVRGVQESTDGGYLFWNNSGRYDDICPPRSEKSAPLFPD